jgi:hypothetical protein
MLKKNVVMRLTFMLDVLYNNSEQNGKVSAKVPNCLCFQIYRCWLRFAFCSYSFLLHLLQGLDPLGRSPSELACETVNPLRWDTLNREYKENRSVCEHCTHFLLYD